MRPAELVRQRRSASPRAAGGSGGRLAIPGGFQKSCGGLSGSSLAGLLTIPYQSHYSATKAAVETFTEGLRQELRPFGIGVASVLPGDIRTRFNNETRIPASLWREDSPYLPCLKVCWETIDKNLRQAPPPDEVARVVWRTATDRRLTARYTAGDLFSRQVPWLVRLLPAGVKESLVRRFYGIEA